jgi:hypothetical protein
MAQVANFIVFFLSALASLNPFSVIPRYGQERSEEFEFLQHLPGDRAVDVLTPRENSFDPD